MYSIVPRPLNFTTLRALLVALCAGGLLVACGDALDSAGSTISSGGGSGNGSIGGNGTASSSGGGGPQTSYTIGGNVMGLTGSGLMLQDNAGNTKTITGNGGFTFSTSVAGGADYDVTILAQPTVPSQTCSVMNGVGKVGTVNVASVVVSCTMNFYTVAGSVGGLVGTGLVLQTNGANNVPVSSNGNYTFATLASGTPFTVTVMTQPTNPSQTCTVANDTGTVTAANVTNVVVSCTTNQYTLTANVSGLVGSGLVLQTNGGNNLPVNASGSYVLATLPSGSAYVVTVLTQPGTPAQWCMVGNGTGTLTMADIANVSVTCRTTGKFVYVTNTWDGNNGSISGFTINPASGALTPIFGMPFTTTDLQPYGIAIDPSGSFAYVANFDSADVVSYTVAPSGLLTLFGTTSTGAPGVNRPFSATMDPSGTYLYVGSDLTNANGAMQVYTINAGTLTAVGAAYPTGNTPLRTAVDSEDQFLYAPYPYDGYVGGYGIEANGVLAAIAGAPFEFQAGIPTNAAYGIAIYPGGGFLYLGDYLANTVTAYAYNSNGILTELAAPLAVGVQPESVAVDPSGRFLYVANTGDGTVTEFSISPKLGTLTLIGTVPASGVASITSSTGVSVDPSGQFVYVVNGDAPTISAFSIIQTSGALIAIGSYATGPGDQNLAIH
jgi:6-phosphogluconolactonase (cycloisomerase 2 family)